MGYLTNAEVSEVMERIFGHRITDGRVSGKWIVWDTTTSTFTNGKFVLRAKSAGIKGVFHRAGKIGCLAPVPVICPHEGVDE